MRGTLHFMAGLLCAIAIGAGLYLWKGREPQMVQHVIEMDGSAPEPYIASHLAILERENRGPVGVLFLGDSITHGWRDVPWIFDEAFGKYNPCNAGVIFDKVQNVRWRAENGELDGINPSVIVLQIGINNLGIGHEPPVAVAREIAGLAADIHTRHPHAKVAVLGLFPAIGEMAGKVRETNNLLRRQIDFPNVTLYDVGESIPPGDFPDGTHPSPDGYRKLAKVLLPIVTPNP